MSNSSSPLALELSTVTKRFGDRTAVDQLSLEVPAGVIWGFLGPNGSGKTTTLRMILGLLWPDEGWLKVLGQRPEAARDRLGYLPEERGIYQRMRVLELLVYFARLKGLSSAEAKSRAGELLERFGLADRAKARCSSLSKGLGQKLQVLATLIHRPRLVLLDEPFSGLDPVHRDVMREAIQEAKDQGATVLFSTHLMEQAEELCDGLVLLRDGQKVLDGTLAEVRGGGQRDIHLAYEPIADVPVPDLRSLPGVERVRDTGYRAEIGVAEEGVAQEILSALVGRVRVRRFEVREPSLHEIYVRAVGTDSQAISEASSETATDLQVGGDESASPATQERTSP
ncbi:MAG: ATP-binding cassette domain-containing protein [Acidobacteriota bacterium]